MEIIGVIFQIFKEVIYYPARPWKIRIFIVGGRKEGQVNKVCSVGASVCRNPEEAAMPQHAQRPTDGHPGLAHQISEGAVEVTLVRSR